MALLSSCVIPADVTAPGFVTSTCIGCKTIINDVETSTLKVNYTTGTAVTVTVNSKSLIQVWDRNNIRVFDTVATGTVTYKYK